MCTVLVLSPRFLEDRGSTQASLFHAGLSLFSLVPFSRVWALTIALCFGQFASQQDAPFEVERALEGDRGVNDATSFLWIVGEKGTRDLPRSLRIRPRLCVLRAVAFRLEVMLVDEVDKQLCFSQIDNRVVIRVRITSSISSPPTAKTRSQKAISSHRSGRIAEIVVAID